MPTQGTWRFAAIIVVLSTLVIVPFLIWGDDFDAMFSMEGTRRWLEPFGPWAWLAGIALLAGDVVLPIPSTVVLSVLGFLYGWWWGGCAGTLGVMLAGFVAYGLSRLFGRPAARWLAGDQALQKGEALFMAGGGWLVALSRWTPVLAEVIACLAGLSRMPFRDFTVALACGSLPLGFLFAAIGHIGQDKPGFALLLSALAPILLWLAAHRYIRAAGGQANP